MIKWIRRYPRFLHHIFPATLLVVIICICAVPTNAQTRHFRNYSVDDGLAFVQVYTIFQDSKGYLWSGGYGGLSRFDGRTFTNFSPSDGLPNHWITSITEDKQKNLWVGTIEGASRMRNGRFENYNASNGLPGNSVSCLLQTQNRALWFGTDKGVCLFNGINFMNFGDKGPGRQEIYCIYEQPNTDIIWLGTEKGVYSYADGRFTHYPMPGFLDSHVKALAHDANGQLLAGTLDGVYILGKDSRFRMLIPPASFPVPQVNALFTDGENMTWIGAANGLFVWDGKNFLQVNISQNINSEKIDCIYQDYEGSLWLGTHAGLYRYRGNAFTSYGVHDGLTNYFIFGITKDKTGDIWACSETGGAFRLTEKGFINYTTADGLASNHTNDAETTPDGAVWIATGNGLSRFFNGKWQTFTSSDGLNSDTVNALMVDHRGRLWTGGGQGISCYENGRFTAYSIPHNTRKLFDIWYISESRDGQIWVGTYLGGLYVFDGKHFKDALKLTGLQTESYFSICQDKTGRFYFGTLDGVFAWDGHKLDHISENNGLNSDLVYCMQLDQENQYLFIGTNQGLNRLDLDVYRRSGQKNIATYGKEDGFTGVECNSNGAYLDDKNVMWFGTVNGLIRYNPSEYRLNPAYTKTNITNIRLFYNDTAMVSGTELPYWLNNISFEFIGICLSQPAKVSYRYKLEGFDKEWSPPSFENTATYANLPPGNYVLRVISCNNEGLWSPQPTEFRFIIQTPIWRKGWFQLLLIAGFLVLASVVILLRIRQIKRRERREAETQVAMSRNELKALRAQMNPHFVFNSLNSIQHFILNNKTIDAGKYLNKFARLIRLILYNSEKSSITVREELEYLQLYLDLEMLRFDNRFHYTVDITEDIDIDYIEIPAMLLQPYVENAILHGLMPREKGGELKIAFRLTDNTLVCSITDNGIGREKSIAIRQLSKQKDHKSLGMKITNDRLELINRLNGSNMSLTITDLYDESQQASGTRVDIFIPVS